MTTPTTLTPGYTAEETINRRWIVAIAQGGVINPTHLSEAWREAERSCRAAYEAQGAPVPGDAVVMRAMPNKIVIGYSIEKAAQ